MEPKLRGWLQSSQDPTEVANKVKGIILGFSALIILLAASIFHVTLSAGDVISLASEFGIAAGGIWAVYGAILHLITWLGTVKSQ